MGDNAAFVRNSYYFTHCHWHWLFAGKQQTFSYSQSRNQPITVHHFLTHVQNAVCASWSLASIIQAPPFLTQIFVWTQSSLLPLNGQHHYVDGSVVRRLSRAGNWWVRDRDHHSESTTGYIYPLCGIFYFPWHRHQVEGTNGF